MHNRCIRAFFAALLWCGLFCAPQLAFAAGDACVAADEPAAGGSPGVAAASGSVNPSANVEGAGSDVAAGGNTAAVSENAPDAGATETGTYGANETTPVGGAGAGNAPGAGETAPGGVASTEDSILAGDSGLVEGQGSTPGPEANAAPGKSADPSAPTTAVSAPAAMAVPATPQAVASAPTAAKTAASAKTAEVDEAAEKKAPSISYQAHSQNVGWQNAVSSGMAGTTSKSLRLEALKVIIDLGDYKGGLQMQARVQNVGWQNVLGNGKTMGTTGKSQSIQALKMMLIGELSKYYDIKYRAHVQNIGWQGWKYNGALAGTASDPLRIEAVEIQLEKKTTPAKNESAGIVGLRYQVHVQNIGWQDVKAAGYDAGTTGRSLRVEALRLWFDRGTALKGDIEYRVHVQNKGWMSWVKNGALAGTTGKSLRVEAVQIRLTGDLNSIYDIKYTAHVQNVGWQYQRYNDNAAGTTGQSLRVEALNISPVAKNSWSGWYGSGKSWQYKQKGTVLKGRWMVTAESPIATNPGTQRYWIDTTGKLAVSRFVEPGKARDKGSWSAYATGDGYVFRGGLSKLAGAWYYADNDGKLSKVGNISSKVSTYVNWAIRIANDDSHGYSQINRWGPDYDCSSLVIAALQYAGFHVGEAVYTGNMVSELTKYGFVFRTDLNNLRSGDILWVHNNSHQHTEIYVGGGQIVGASSSENGGIRGRVGDQTGREIRVRSYYNMPWAGYLRAS